MFSFSSSINCKSKLPCLEGPRPTVPHFHFTSSFHSKMILNTSESTNFFPFLASLAYIVVKSLLRLFFLSSSDHILITKAMDKRSRTQPKRSHCCYDEEVSSIEWELINMSEQEEDLICRMHKLVGDRWPLIAGRIPGRKAEEIERFWLMKNWKAHSCKPKVYNKSSKS